MDEDAALVSLTSLCRALPEACSGCHTKAIQCFEGNRARPRVGIGTVTLSECWSS